MVFLRKSTYSRFSIFIHGLTMLAYPTKRYTSSIVKSGQWPCAAVRCIGFFSKENYGDMDSDELSASWLHGPLGDESGSIIDNLDNLGIARDSNRHPGEVAWSCHKEKNGLIMFDPDQGSLKKISFMDSFGMS